MINSEIIRDYFPSLSRVDNNNNQIIYLDGPGGTQVPIQVIEAISQYYIRSNANTHGEFVTSKETDYITTICIVNFKFFPKRKLLRSCKFNDFP